MNQARVSQIINKVDTDKINNLFYEAHKEVDKIAEVVGVSFKEVGNLVENFNTKLFNQEYAAGLTPEQIATNHNLDEACE